jgi:hypothetical protein
MNPLGQLDRRQAIAAGATAVAISIVPRHVLGGPGHSASPTRPVLARCTIRGQNGLEYCFSGRMRAEPKLKIPVRMPRHATGPRLRCPTTGRFPTRLISAIRFPGIRSAVQPL